MPRIDLKRLKTDVAALQAKRPAKLGLGGRPLTGAMACVRENLAALEAMKSVEVTWTDIATALAAQGVVQGQDGQPLTGRRLTALIASVKRQDARRAAKSAMRLKRSDALFPSQTPLASRARLAPELSRPDPNLLEKPADAEEKIRLANFHKHGDLFKKG